MKTMNRYDSLSMLKKLLLVVERSIVPVSAAFDLCLKVKNQLSSTPTKCTECEAVLWEGNQPVNWMRKVTDHLNICRKKNISNRGPGEG